MAARARVLMNPSEQSFDSFHAVVQGLDPFVIPAAAQDVAGLDSFEEHAQCGG